jgi:hypothetical protein
MRNIVPKEKTLMVGEALCACESIVKKTTDMVYYETSSSGILQQAYNECVCQPRQGGSVKG